MREDGIIVDDACSVNIHHNYIADCKLTGITVWDGGTPIIEYNEFENNGCHIHHAGIWMEQPPIRNNNGYSFNDHNMDCDPDEGLSLTIDARYNYWQTYGPDYFHGPIIHYPPLSSPDPDAGP